MENTRGAISDQRRRCVREAYWPVIAVLHYRHNAFSFLHIALRQRVDLEIICEPSSDGGPVYGASNGSPSTVDNVDRALSSAARSRISSVCLARKFDCAVT